MPAALTELTELVTALGTLSYPSAAEATAARPAELLNVADEQWRRLEAAVADRANAAAVHAAFNNGRALLRAVDGLRGRPPRRIEWKGPHRPPAYELVPADLRIDHVYLVSCKYMSKILMNVAPAHLFERALAVRDGDGRLDWYEAVAAAAYDDFYAAVRHEVGHAELPADRRLLTAAQRHVLQAATARSWPPSLAAPYAEFSRTVGEASADRWRRCLRTTAERELMLWRLLRLYAAPYFVLGAARGAHLRLRIGTPWDWRQQFRLRSLTIAAATAAGQPTVTFSAAVDGPDGPCPVEGHVEVRWSHGRFSGFPEAKVYLDTPHHLVPGYFALA